MVEFFRCIALTKLGMIITSFSLDESSSTDGQVVLLCDKTTIRSLCLYVDSISPSKTT